MDTSFSEWLQDEIKKRGWNQNNLAKASGLSRQAISKYIKQQKIYPDPGALTAIAHALNLPPELVYQAAGILTATPSPRTLLEKILIHRISILTDDQLDEVSNYINFIMTREGNAPYRSTPTTHYLNEKPGHENP